MFSSMSEFIVSESMVSLKTPGVYLRRRETDLRGPVLEESAIPAFIGYTERNTFEGKSLLNRPVWITDLNDFEFYFGGAPEAPLIRIELDSTNNYALINYQLLNPELIDQKPGTFYLYSSLKLFFENGGEGCYIVSVGTLDGPGPVLGDRTFPDTTPGFLTGLQALERETVTIILFPDGVLLPNEELYRLQREALAQCGDFLDRFCVFDLPEWWSRAAKDDSLTSTGSFLVPDSPAASLKALSQQFRERSGADLLQFGAVYVPWLQPSFPPGLDFENLEFVDECGDLLDWSCMALPFRFHELLENLEMAVWDLFLVNDKQRELYTQNISVLLAASETLFKAEDEINAGNFSESLKTMRPLLEYAAALSKVFFQWLSGEESGLKSRPNLKYLESRIQLGEPGYRNGSLGRVQDLLDRLQIQDLDQPADGPGSHRIEAFTDFFRPSELGELPSWLGPVPIQSPGTPTSMEEDALDAYDILSRFVLAPESMQEWFEEKLEQGVLVANAEPVALEAIMLKLAEKVADRKLQLQELAYTTHPVLMKIIPQLTVQQALVPPSGAIAGIYARTDEERGVWKAPANIEVLGVKGLSVDIDDRFQGFLNIDAVGGKSINALRSFPGKGVLVFGGRTLDGNDVEWRYVSVRRFVSYIGRMLRNVVEPLVFDPNYTPTYNKIRRAADRFLLRFWMEGALLGNNPKEAYTIKIGLNETMRPEDILEGRLIVEIGLAVSRPAEFIVLTLNFFRED